MISFFSHPLFSPVSIFFRLISETQKNTMMNSLGWFHFNVLCHDNCIIIIFIDLILLLIIVTVVMLRVNSSDINLLLKLIKILIISTICSSTHENQLIFLPPQAPLYDKLRIKFFSINFNSMHILSLAQQNTKTLKHFSIIVECIKDLIRFKDFLFDFFLTFTHSSCESMMRIKKNSSACVILINFLTT